MNSKQHKPLQIKSTRNASTQSKHNKTTINITKQYKTHQLTLNKHNSKGNTITPIGSNQNDQIKSDKTRATLQIKAQQHTYQHNQNTTKQSKR